MFKMATRNLQTRIKNLENLKFFPVNRDKKKHTGFDHFSVKLYKGGLATRQRYNVRGENFGSEKQYYRLTKNPTYDFS